MIPIPDNDENLTSKIDASVGLLANVPQALLGRLFDKLDVSSNEEEKIEITILYRYSSESIKKVIEDLGGEFYDLEFNYGLAYVPVNRIRDLALSNEIQYMELPKSLYEADLESNRESCVLQVTSSYNVTGKGVVIGFIDSGIDYTHPAFKDTNGDTRIEYIYDLSNNDAVYDKEQINRAIKSQDPFSIVPENDSTGHGTHVVGDACAGGRLPNKYRGAAPDASIIMVKGGRGNWVLSSQIMKGLKFLLDKSKELDMPLVVNISLSTNNGAHNGSSLLEQYISVVSNLERVTIVIAAGNEGDAGHHTGNKLERFQTESFNVASDETTLVINMYKSVLPDVSINIVGPTGQQSNEIKINQGYFTGSIGRDRYDIYVSGPKPFELENEIQIVLSSVSSQYLVEGTWNIGINVINDYLGKYSIWLPISEGLNPKTKFLNPEQLNTLGIPATVTNIIAVGSYNGITGNLSSFSGRGSDRSCLELIRPDMVAPGENVLGPLPNGGYDSKTGTSMAAPQVAGICALFTEWGLVKSNDPYLFGQRLKYYLIKGANRTRTDIDYPNPSWGYGTVCAADSFEILINDVSGSSRQIKSRQKNGNSNTVNPNSNVNNTNTTNTNTNGSNTNTMNINNSGSNANNTGANNTSTNNNSNNNQVINEGIIEDDNSYQNTDTALKSLSDLAQSEIVDKNEIIGLLVQVFTQNDLKRINDIPNASAVSISENYIIVRIPLGQVNELKPYIKEIVSVYNPSIYTLSALSPVEASGAGIFSQNPYLMLDGTNVLVGVIDTGIDYLSKEFMREDDTTRIVRIWDQTIDSNSVVEGIEFGTQYTEEQINQAIQLSMKGGDPYSIVPSKDEIGHGTMSAGIIGGRGINPDLLGAAPNCDFIVVKVKPVGKFVLEQGGIALDKVAYGNIELILAIRYLSRVAEELKRPLVIYFPFGTNIGAHDGTSYIEGVLETQGRRVGVIAVAGTGNQGDTQTHIEGNIEKTGDINIVEIKVGKNQNNLNFQMYFQKPDKVEVGIVSPSGEVLDKVDIKVKQLKDYKFIYEGTEVTIIYLYPDEANSDETIIIKFKNIREGTWQFRLYGEKIVDGRYWAWLPQRELLDKDTRFFDPIQKTTLTMPGTARGTLVTSYYNQDLNTTVTQSGRGYTRDGRIKPDITAGGVNALVPMPGGGTTTATGSSVATSVIAGCCALLLQWAIINRNDPEVRASKIISYVIRGAKMRQGDIYPNIDWGYGILDMKNIFDAFRDENKLKEIKESIDNNALFNDSETINIFSDENYDEFTKGNLFFRIPKK